MLLIDEIKHKKCWQRYFSTPLWRSTNEVIFFLDKKGNIRRKKGLDIIYIVFVGEKMRYVVDDEWVNFFQKPDFVRSS